MSLPKSLGTLVALSALADPTLMNALAQAPSATNAPPAQTSMPASDTLSGDDAGEVEALESMAGNDPTFIMPTAPVESVIGFNKSILDTPRSVTVLSAELLEAAGVENVEDLYRVAPSTYTNFRFGLQGGINVRNQAGDYYFRGMKKPDPQGNYRTIFTAFDSIEVVRGPASPIFGGGRIGGYLNFNPKTARSVTGKYMEKFEGKVSMTLGSWDKRVAQLEYGGPIKGLPGDRKAGLYFYGFFEDSAGYYETSFDKHLVGQLALSADLTDSWRVETGLVIQDSKGGLNGGVNRVTEELFSEGKYWSGGFSVPLDANGDGKIADREIFASRPSTATYNPIFVSFGTVTGKPDFKQEVDATGKPTGPIRRVDTGAAIGTGANALLGLPEPWQLDYGSFRLVDYDFARTLGEDYYQADIYDVYFDVINDNNEELTLKNQLYFHSYDQVKDGRNPFSQIQRPTTLENKFTAGHVADWQPEWLKGQYLASVNLRYTDTYRENTTNSDYDQRRDLMSGPNGGFSPNDTFYSFLERRGLDGSAITRINDSEYIETGVGLLTDQTFFDMFNLVAGGRFDYVAGDYRQPEGVFLNKNAANVGTTANLENRITTTAQEARGDDKELSWSLSASYLAPLNIRPYFTVAQQAALLMDTSDASISPSSWGSGPYAKSEIYEAGIKSSLLENKLFAAVAVFQQTRIAFSTADGTESVDKTISRGVELEMRYVPIPSVSIVGSAVWSRANYLSGGTVRVNGRYVGFSDVTDPATGEILVPAEAFGWGGIPQVTIPNGSTYSEVEGIPDKILNLFVTYTHSIGLGVGVGVSHQGAFASDRTEIWKLPSATTANATVFYNKGKWQAKLDFNNITDEQYFVKGANNGMMVGVRQPFNIEGTLSRAF